MIEIHLLFRAQWWCSHIETISFVVLLACSFPAKLDKPFFTPNQFLGNSPF
jgi:hypothetical protein